MKSPTIRKPVGDLEDILCRACGERRPLNSFRFFQTKPELLYMDFCVECEKQHGTLGLYRRFNAYGTQVIIDAVFAAGRAPIKARTEEQQRLLVDPIPVLEPVTNEELIRRELARREMARRRLVYFTATFIPNYKPGWVHQDLCRRLERFVLQVEAGLSPRLMIHMPPRAGKSQIASGTFPSWALGKHPEWGIIAASYNLELPVEFSRENRDRLRDPDYQAIFPGTVLNKEAQGIERWKTTKNGGYLAAGVGTGITGKGMHIGIADDIIKDYEAAMSEQIRLNTYHWYNTVFRNRLAPGGGILYISTRWHYDDPAGRLVAADQLLAKMGVPLAEREGWEVVSYPAIADDDEFLMRDGTIFAGSPEDESQVLRLLRKKGAALHPERYSLPELLKLKNAYTAGQWSALYQQKPTPDEGDFFKKADFQFQYLDPMYRPFARIFMCVDYAIGKKERNDFTVMGVFALTAEDKLFCLEMRRGRWGTYEIAQNAVSMIMLHKPEVYAGEQGQIHAAVWPVILKALKAVGGNISVDDSLVPIQDKETRARPIQARMQQRSFYFSYEGGTRPEVYGEAMLEMLQFPNGVHDDTVDCCAWAGRLALNLSLPRTNKRPPPKSWKDDLRITAANSDPMAA
jgi:predicted phage terminase large subunit-like protein